MLSLIVSAILWVFPVSPAVAVSGGWWSGLETISSLWGWKSRFAVEMLTISIITFGDISTSGLGSHMTISGCRWSSKSLFLNSPRSILQIALEELHIYHSFLLKCLGGLFLPQAHRTRVKIEAQYDSDEAKALSTLSQKSASVTLSPFSRRFRRQSPLSATVSLFCDSVDRA